MLQRLPLHRRALFLAFPRFFLLLPLPLPSSFQVLLLVKFPPESVIDTNRIARHVALPTAKQLLPGWILGETERIRGEPFLLAGRGRGRRRRCRLAPQPACRVTSGCRPSALGGAGLRPHGGRWVRSCAFSPPVARSPEPYFFFHIYRCKKMKNKTKNQNASTGYTIPKDVLKKNLPPNEII